MPLWDLGVSIAASGSTAAVVVYILQKLFEGRLRLHFDSRLEAEKHEHEKEIAVLKGTLEAMREKGGVLYRSKLDAFTALSTLVYRCRLTAKDILDKQATNVPFEAEQFEKDRLLLGEAIAKNRLYLSAMLFDKVHAFKHELLTFQTYLSLLASKELDAAEWTKRIHAKYEAIDQAYTKIVAELQEEMATGASPAEV
jgi:hypothetical protein